MKIEEMIKNNRADCCGCESCANICPKHAIEMIRDSEGFAYPKINPELCIKCGRCDATCPSLNFSEKFPYALPKVFLAIHQDEKILRHSSSGGVFSALSEIILNDGGIIFGAGFDDNWHVKHMQAENFIELEKLRGSKYVQSQIGDVYRRIKKYLEGGRKVLFSGTSCQCAGLKHFLGKDYDNLLTVDIICHGTPSPMLWENYIDWVGQGHEISHVNFRSKRFGWQILRFEVDFKDCGYLLNRGTNISYVKLFLSNTILRKSCYACKFRFPNAGSDITCGDAWGIRKFAPELFDDTGASLAVIHTYKGQKFFDRANLKIQKVDFDVLKKYNPYFFIPSAEDFRRKDFFGELAKTKNPMAVMQKYFAMDSSKTVADNRRQNRKKLNARYEKILEHFANKPERSILIITKIWHKNLKDLIVKNFIKSTKQLEVMVAGVRNDGAKKILRIFDSEAKELQYEILLDNETVLNFCNRFNVKVVIIVEPLPFDKQIIADALKNYEGMASVLKVSYS